MTEIRDAAAEVGLCRLCNEPLGTVDRGHGTDWSRTADPYEHDAEPYEQPDGRVEAIRDTLAGWPIGSGFYSLNVGTDEARDMAEAVLAALDSRVIALDALTDLAQR